MMNEHIQEMTDGLKQVFDENSQVLFITPDHKEEHCLDCLNSFKQDIGSEAIIMVNFLVKQNSTSIVIHLFNTHQPKEQWTSVVSAHQWDNDQQSNTLQNQYSQNLNFLELCQRISYIITNTQDNPDEKSNYNLLHTFYDEFMVTPIPHINSRKSY